MHLGSGRPGPGPNPVFPVFSWGDEHQSPQTPLELPGWGPFISEALSLRFGAPRLA
jgi:hypothetical protein